MARWAMVIDLNKCIGCGTCKAVCEQLNEVPPGARWRRLVVGENHGNPRMTQLCLALNCMHCEKPACLKVCPTTATNRRADGIVDINYDLCVGCGACVLACPYSARAIKYEDKLVLQEELDGENQNAAIPDRIGICTKCNFCLDRLLEGLRQKYRPGVDPEATPLCVQFCIANAVLFGDLDDSKSEVASIINGNNTVRLQLELGTEPSVYYILQEKHKEDQEVSNEQIIPPSKQHTWGWPAVVHFILSGVGCGSYLVNLLRASLQDGLLAFSTPVQFSILAALLISLGIFSLIIEVGRPKRGLYVLRNLRHSWISRETVVCAILVPALVFDRLFSHPILRIFTLALASWLMLSQGFIVYRSLAITAWNVAIIPLFFLFSGLSSGYGFSLLVDVFYGSTFTYYQTLTGLICVFGNLVVWILYLCWSSNPNFNLSTRILRHPADLIFSVGFGHVVPFLVLLAYLTLQGDNSALVFQYIVSILLALVIIAVVVYEKAGIILASGHTRGISIKEQEVARGEQESEIRETQGR